MQPLAWRAGEDFEASFKRIFGFGEGEFGFAAFEQLGEQHLEIRVHLLERFQQAFAAFAVEALDAAAQAVDCAIEIGTVGD